MSVSSPPARKPAPLTGISMKLLTNFVDSNMDVLTGMTTRQVYEEIIMDICIKEKSCYLKHSGDDQFFAKDSTYFVSHCWEYYFLDFYELLFNWWKSKGSCEDDYFWIDLFVVNWYETKGVRNPEWIPEVLQKCSKGALIVMLYWDMPVYMQSSRCLFDYFLITSAMTNKAIPSAEVLQSDDSKDRLLDYFMYFDFGADEGVVFVRYVMVNIQGMIDTNARTVTPAAMGPFGGGNDIINNNNNNESRSSLIFEEAVIKKIIGQVYGFDTFNKTIAQRMSGWLGFLILRKLTEFRDVDSVMFLRMQLRIANHFVRMGLLEDAIRLCSDNISLRVNKYGSDSWHIAPCFGLLGVIFQKMNKLDDALIYFYRELKIVEEVYGKNHGETLAVLNALGNTYRLMGVAKKNECWEIYQRCLQIAEGLFGTDSYNISPAYNNAAVALSNLGKFEEALKYSQKAVSIARMFFDDDDERVKSLQDNMKAISDQMANANKNKLSTTSLRDAIKAEKQKTSSAETTTTNK